MLITPPPVGEDARIRHNQEVSGISHVLEHKVRRLVGNAATIDPLFLVGVQVQGQIEIAQTPERTNANTQKYVEACKAAGAELGVPVLDIWTKMQEQPEWETEYLSDGLHLTPAGNQFLFDNLQELINVSVPQLKYVHCLLPVVEISGCYKMCRPSSYNCTGFPSLCHLPVWPFDYICFYLPTVCALHMHMYVLQMLDLSPGLSADTLERKCGVTVVDSIVLLANPVVWLCPYMLKTLDHRALMSFRRVETMADDFPLHADIDAAKPAAAFKHLSA